ncbi:hypothetical protein BKA70DRAFT_1235164 [Coprinopsis sp. MPI-PUGE-AT-0042]|nr:hypothetical protein BKA70DRAFT_1235164 [Coprinopsis sp. MPI-PUGE-AT-0042]
MLGERFQCIALEGVRRTHPLRPDSGSRLRRNHKGLQMQYPSPEPSQNLGATENGAHASSAPRYSRDHRESRGSERLSLVLESAASARMEGFPVVPNADESGTVDGDSIVVMNTGAHWPRGTLYMLPKRNSVDEEHDVLKQVYGDMIAIMVERLNQLRRVKIMYRASNAAHPDCSNKKRPYQDFADAVGHESDMAQQFKDSTKDPHERKVRLRWDWDMFDTLNDLWREKIRRLGEQREILQKEGRLEAELPPAWRFLDVWAMTLQRPDAHSDCLHWCLPTMYNEWSRHLLHVLHLESGLEAYLLSPPQYVIISSTIALSMLSLGGSPQIFRVVALPKVEEPGQPYKPLWLRDASMTYFLSPHFKPWVADVSVYGSEAQRWTSLSSNIYLMESAQELVDDLSPSPPAATIVRRERSEGGAQWWRSFLVLRSVDSIIDIWFAHLKESQYCSSRCQRQHWARHRTECESKLNNTTWQPSWIVDGRRPSLRPDNVHISLTGGSLWNKVPGFDVLNLKLKASLPRYIKTSRYVSPNHLLTHPSGAGDLRNLIRTVNSLPRSYRGQCDILFNDPDAISANRNLLILYVLLTPGPPVDEVAELALHPMYSARLTSLASAYVRCCVSSIYGDLTKPAEMPFHRTFASRGKGKLHSTQPATSIKGPVEMFLSQFDLSKALRRRRYTLMDPHTVDNRHKILASLEPAYRLAVMHFWKTGVLSPYSFDLTEFTEPNRVYPDSAFIVFYLHRKVAGWANPMTSSLCKGGTCTRLKGVDKGTGWSPLTFLGAFFFHTREELCSFVNQIKSLNINIHHTQYDPRVLSKALSAGVLPSMTEALFGRVDADRIRSSESGPAVHPETILEMLKRRCKNIPSLRPRLKKLLEQGLHSPSMIRLIESLDVFVDTGPAFQDYLHSQNVIDLSEELSIRQKRRNTVQPKVTTFDHL